MLDIYRMINGNLINLIYTNDLYNPFNSLDFYRICESKEY